MRRNKVIFIFLGALSGLIASQTSAQCNSSTLYSKEFAAGDSYEDEETVALDLSGFAGTTVNLNFNSVVPECFTGPGQVHFANIAMNGICLPSDVIFSSDFGDISQPFWNGCGGFIELDGCPADNTPVNGSISVSVTVPLGQENILTFNLIWFVLNDGNESRFFSITTGCNSESEEAGCTDCAGMNTLFNPDYSGDGFIGVDDILGVLSFYGNVWDGPEVNAIYGCTYPMFLEYNASANVDDGSCSGFCGSSLSYQGYDYATVQIGGQCWFAENLRSENYENGDEIPAGLSDSEWSSTISGATTVYGESPSNLETYGRLYNWYAVNDARGLCPSGWHVPTDGEWMTMEIALGMDEADANNTGFRGPSIGTQMKAEYGWANGGNGTNSSGFSGLPGGRRYPNSGDFAFAGDYGEWWSSSPSGSNAWYRNLVRNYNSVYREYIDQQYGLSVRCIRDID